MKYLISITYIFLLSERLLFACSWGDIREFHPLIGIEMLSDTASLEVGFYPTIPRYRTELYHPDSTKLSPIAAGLILEWKSRYPEANHSDIRDLLFANQEKSIDDRFFNSHPFGKQLHAADRIYFKFAKKCEVYANAKVDLYWEGILNRSEETKMEMVALSEEGKKELDAIGGDPFLRQRYLFQLVRLFHYADKPQKVIDTYAELKGAEGEKTLTWWRTRAILAGALRKTGQNAKSKYEFAAIFNGCPALGPLAYRNCKYIDSASFEEAIELAQNPQERSALYFIRQVWDNLIDPNILEKLFSEAFNSDRLEVAVLKQLANIESNIYYPWLAKKLIPIDADTTFGGDELWNIALGQSHGNDAAPLSWWSRIWNKFFTWVTRLFHLKVASPIPLPSNLKDSPIVIPIIHSATWKESEITGNPSKDKRISDFQSFCAKVAATKNVRNPALFHSAAGYAALMRQDWDACLFHSASVKKTGGNHFAAARTAEFLSLYARIERGNPVDTAFETELKNFFATVDKRIESFEAQRIQLGLETARRYIDENRISRAAAILAYVNDNAGELLDIYLSVQDIDSLIALRKSPKATPFERLILDSLPVDKVMQEIAGTKMLRSGDFNGALQRFKSCGKGYWKKSQTKIQSYHGIDDVITMNKLEFAIKAVELQKDSSYNGLMKLGHHFHYDNFWAYVSPLWKESGKILIDYLRNDGEGVGDYPFNTNPEFLTEFENRKSIFLSQYTSQQMAAKIYTMAMNKTGNSKEKAEALFSMYSACKVNETSVETIAHLPDMKKLLAQIRDPDALVSEPDSLVEYFAEIASQCAELGDFLEPYLNEESYINE